MSAPAKKELVGQVLMAIRDYNVSTKFFRNTVVEKLGVNITDWECLGLLLQKGVSTPTELAEHTGLTSGATTAMLDRLEKNGIIERRRNPDDRRGTLVIIVEEKATEMAALLASAREAQNRFLAQYTTKELEFLSDFIEKLTAVIDGERDQMRQSIRNG